MTNWTIIFSNVLRVVLVSPGAMTRREDVYSGRNKRIRVTTDEIDVLLFRSLDGEMRKLPKI
jgi:hypothetical protein